MDINTATFLLHGPEMRGSATQLSRTAEDQVRIRGGSLTTCAPDNNDWSIVASDIHLDQGEGVGTAKHVRLEISDIPVFYWPYASFPIDDRRKTGFLYPSFGTSNAGSGAFLSRMDSRLSETLNSGLVYTAPFALLTETGLC